VKAPYLSIVVPVRNDNYGGDFIERLQNCISWNSKWMEDQNLHAEIVLVYWNPLQNSKSLLEVIDWPKDLKYVHLRLVTVPYDVHQKYINPEIRDTVPLYEFIAKNTGIRRANGDFILSINADVLIHPQIFKTIAEKKLQGDTYYRANRLDFKKTPNMMLSGFFQAGFTISLKGFLYYFKNKLSVPFQYELLKLLNPIRVKWELFKFNNLWFSKPLGLNIVYNNGAYMAHCLNAGDFLLMSRSQWHKMKGYPEYTLTSVHTDAIFTLLASHRFPETMFKEPVFHQVHEGRYSWQSMHGRGEFEKNYLLFEEVANVIKSGKSTDDYLNKDFWGLVDFELNDKLI
jgi:hypothetical protein